MLHKIINYTVSIVLGLILMFIFEWIVIDGDILLDFSKWTPLSYALQILLTLFTIALAVEIAEHQCKDNEDEDSN